MKRRLALVGIGSISNVVDITNYILKELGQPMHAFDSSYIEGNAIHVRRAHDKEKIVTLDEKEFELNENNLVICDGVKPVALAGIMGGLNSEIRDTTEAVIFESAKFEETISVRAPEHWDSLPILPRDMPKAWMSMLPLWPVREHCI